MSSGRQHDWVSETKKNTGPVECLGQTFESDEARREHYLALLAEKLKDPEFRKTPGFPKGTDEAILRLSDPPYYTACPNPFLEGFIESWVDCSRVGDARCVGPYAADISVGKGDRSYYIHGYHTKVPPSAVSQLIRHYARPGDLVLDCFSGSGMTGLASTIDGTPEVATVLADLSSSAGFISYFHSRFRPNQRQRELVASTFDSAQRQFEKYYKTKHVGWLASSEAPVAGRNPGQSTAVQHGQVVFTVWSEVVRCPDCGKETPLWDATVDLPRNSVAIDFGCSQCDAHLTKTVKGAKKRGSSLVETVHETVFDQGVGRGVKRVKRVPMLISYEYQGKRFEKYPDEDDIAAIQDAETASVGDWFPTAPIPAGDKTGDPKRAGITHVHQYYPKRTLASLAFLASRLRGEPGLIGFVTSILTRCSWQNRYMPQHRGNRSREVVGPLSGTLYIPPFALEINPISYGQTKSKQILRRLAQLDPANVIVSTESAAGLHEGMEAQIDYAFIDPPFGANLQYSELSFAMETWLQVTTNAGDEMVVNTTQQKSVQGYGQLMRSAFHSVQQSLRPGSWVTIEFSNSSNAIWNAIQSAVGDAGLVVADVRILDKKKGTTKQLTQINTVKQDLIISAYRPLADKQAESLISRNSSKEAVWEFISEHLGMLPVFVRNADTAEPIIERESHRLFDRLVSFCVRHNIAVPVSFGEFQEELGRRYPHRDGMHFLHGQVSEYDRKRTTVGELRQLTLFVSDEASATRWIRQQLQTKPQSFQDLQPQFMQQLQSWDKHEKTIELKEILELNFFCYDGNGPVPSQIKRYLSTNFRDMRNIEEDNPRLQAKAKDRWYVPNPNKEGDLEKLRLRTLLKEFGEYRTSTSRKIKQFRTEAVRAGFKHCYDQSDYATIVAVAAKLPEKVIQEDEKLLMYYDVATMRLGD
jgi:16S rRNA G966 N2-methylase RsmD